MEPHESAGPAGSFGYCAICYHPLDRCSHCENEQNDTFNTAEEAHETLEIRQLFDDLSNALAFLRELTSAACEWGCTSHPEEQPCIRCRAEKWLHTEAK